MARTARGARLGFPLLLLFVLLLGAATPVQSAEKFCSQYGGIIDGNVLVTSPIQVTIDTTCTFQNWPQSNPLTATINFQTNDPTIYLIIFDNVWFDGNMACSNIDHKLWVVNSPEGAFSGACQDMMIPSESIHKKAPATTATIGVPFTYTLTLPAMTSPFPDQVGGPSPNDLGNVAIWDDLNAIKLLSGVDLTFVSINAYWKGSGVAVALEKEDKPQPPVGVTFNPALHSKGGVWTDKNLSYKPIPMISPNTQLVVEITVVLDNTLTNVAGKTFTNTAKWWFSRWIDLDEDGIVDTNEFFNPLPGESGISQIMSIAEPKLEINKTSNTTALNVGDLANFTIDIQNNGGSDAWNATILDKLPLGMCVNDPRTALSAEIVSAGGTPGSGLTLTPGTDYSVAYSGCDLTLTMLTAAARIAPTQRLIIAYQAQIDPLGSPDFPDDGDQLVNVAGATQWFSADSSHAGRRQYDRTLTDGTPTVIDHQDNQATMAAMHGYFFEKTVQNLTSLANPATTAAPGDTLHYKLRVFNVNQNIKSITISDQLDLNYFDPTTFANLTIVTGPSYSATYNPNVTSTGLLQIYGAPDLNVDYRGELEINFDIKLKSSITGTMVSNQAFLTAVDFASPSDDPDINGVASPDVTGDEDATVVMITTPGSLQKLNPAKTTATIGEQFEYTITVPATATSVPLYDVQILDTLPPNLRFVNARVVTGGAWILSSSVTGTVVTIKDTVTGIDIPANGQAKIAIMVELLNINLNQSGGLPFTNSASYTYNRANGVDSTQLAGGGHTTPNMTVVEPRLTANKTVSFVSPPKPATDPATVGDILEYKVTIPNSGNSEAFDANIVDTLPVNVALVLGSATATINGAAVTGFVADPTPSGTNLVWGRNNGDGNLDIPAGQSLVLTYRVTVVDASSVSSFTNSVYADWTSLEGANAEERTGADGIFGLNNYVTGPASVTVNTVDNTSIAKSVNTDSYAETPPSTTDPIVRVGDTVTYDLTLNLQEYTTQNVVVEDVLPAGMALESFTIDSSANFSYTLAAQPVSGATGTLRWEFGNISNDPDGTSTNDALAIRYVAKVVTAPPAVGVGYTTSILRDNLAKLSYTGGDPAVHPARLTAAERVDVRQPLMGAISKVDLGTGRTGAGISADPYQVNIATDVMNFRLLACNNGLAPAYNVQLTDLLANQLDETSITPPVVTVGGTVLTLASDYTYTPPAGRGGTMSFVLNNPVKPVNPGQCVTIDYNIGFYADIAAGGLPWSNSATLQQYESLPANGRIYNPIGTAQVWMTNPVIVQPLTKTLTSPSVATIGETVTYRITVPGTPVNAALSNVVITDTLDSVLTYVTATVAAPFTLTDNTSGQNVSLTIAQIPAGQQAVITLTARVANNTTANAGFSFTNTASYTYDGGSVTSGTSGALTIAEPAVTVDKTVVSSATPPTAGSTLTYTVNLIAAPAPASNAYDLVLSDTLSLGLAYVTGTARISGVPAEPIVTGTPQTLTWSALDITAGTTVTVTYDVLVNNNVVIGQTLTNTATARWTSLDGDFPTYERGGTGVAPNDYVASDSTTLIVGDSTTFVKVRASDTYTAADANVRIGDLIEYELRLGLQEGTHTDVSVTDTLPTGLQYVGMVSATYFGTVQPTPPAPSGTQTLTWSLGTVVNPSDGNPTNDVLVLRYRVRVLNNDTFAQTPTSQTLTNNATLGYTVAGNPVTRPSTASVTVLQPILTVSKSASAAGGDSVINAGEVITYTVGILNSGAAPAYDTVLVDTLPVGLRQGGVTTTAITLVSTNTSLPVLAPVYNATTGVATWDFDSGVANAYTIPAGDTLRVVYQVTADADLGPSLTLTNTAQATLYYSFDDEAFPANGNAVDREVYGPTNTAQQTLTTPVPGGLLKQNPTNTTATIGQEFTYTITVPAVPQATALHDVRILDNLGTVSANLTLVSISKVSGSQAWTPVNTGTSADLVIEDTTNGIEIPANEQIVVSVTVRMNNVGSNVAGLAFSNTASYTYNQIDGNAATRMSGASNTTAVMTVVEPSVTVTKSVNPATPPKAGDILTYTVNLTAASGANFSDAFDAGLVDTLSLGLAYQAGTATVNGTGNTIADPASNGDGITTPQTLTWTWDPNPAVSTADIDIVEGTTVTVTYQVRVLDTVSAGQTLTNSVTARWTSLDGANSDERTGADGIGGLNDYVATAAAPPLTIPIPTLTLQKTVDKPVANPGDRMRYTITIQNPTAVRVANFSLADEIDRLNATPRFQSSIENVVLTSSTGTTAGVSYVINGSTLNVIGNIEANETLTIVFEAVLLTDLKSGTVVLNQAELSGPWPTSIKSDDDLNVLPVANPTKTVIPANGVVYNAVSRKPLGGVSLTMRLSSTGIDLPASCFIDPSQQNQVTPANGTYKFDLNFSQPECPAGSDYLIAVTTAPAGYVADASLIIAPTSDAATAAYSVPVCTADAIPATTTQCEAHVSTSVPTGAVTTYYLHLTLDPTANQIFNNHIPVDPYVEEQISITKTSPLINVTRGQLVPYTITFKNTLRSTLPPLGIVDTLPPGFKYVEGSSRFDGTPLEPAINGRQLGWNNINVGYKQQHTIRLLLVAGAGVSEGEYVNQAQVINTVTGGPFSEMATATVRVIPDPTFDCTDVIGKVFDDRDLNGQQDPDERGLPGVRVVTARGLIATTDEHGRFHVTCAVVPDGIRGSNFILKLDDRTLPTGYRVTTENPRVQRATRGKMLRFNFGATIHHVVSMDVADGAFEPNSTVLRMQWQPRIDLLLRELAKAPSVLRLSYLADVEKEGLVEKRLKALKKEIAGKSNGGYRLTIETEVFWRRGSPP